MLVMEGRFVIELNLQITVEKPFQQIKGNS